MASNSGVPDSNLDSNSDFEQIADEFANRLAANEDVDPAEYVARYPELANQIRDLFPLVLQMHRQHDEHIDRAGHNVDLQRVGDYQIIGEIGRGGMGVVYEAVDESLGRHVAVKVLPAMHTLSSLRVARFEREARAAASLHHTNIVPVFGFGEIDGQHYYVMQLIDGVSLAEWVRKEHESAHEVVDVDASSSSGSSRFRAIAEIGLQIADALQFAHSRGILHRDIKPSNILLDNQGVIWVTDFGLAKAKDSVDLTNSGDLIGTLRYMPPESFEGEISERTDIYSLGLTLYELITLQPAFGTEVREKLVREIVESKLVAPRKINPKVPRDLETIVMRATASDARRRYASAADLREDLRRYLNGEPILARKISTLEKAKKWMRRHPAVATLTVALVAITALGLVGIVWQWRDAVAARTRLVSVNEELETALARKEEALETSDAVADMLGRLFAAGDQFGVSSIVPTSSGFADLGADQLDILAKTEKDVSSLSDEATRANLLRRLAFVHLSRGNVNKAGELMSVSQRGNEVTVEEQIVLGFIRYTQGRFDEVLAILSETRPTNEYERALTDLLAGFVRVEMHASAASIDAAEKSLRKLLQVEADDGKRQHQQFLFYMHLALVRLRMSAHPAPGNSWNECKRLAKLAEQASSKIQDVDIYQDVAALALGLFQQEMGAQKESAILSTTGRQMSLGAIRTLAEKMGEASPVRAVFLRELAGVMEGVAVRRGRDVHLKDAAMIYRLALAGAKKSCPGEPRVAQLQRMLARVLQQLDPDDTEAIELLESSSEINARVLGFDHQDTKAVQRLLDAATANN